MVNSKLTLAKNEFVLVEDINIRDACAFDEAKYKFGIDENQKEVVYDSKNERVLSSAKAGEFASYKEVLESIYTKRGAFKKVTGNGSLTLDRSQNTVTPIPNRHNMADHIKLGKK